MPLEQYVGLFLTENLNVVLGIFSAYFFCVILLNQFCHYFWPKCLLVYS